MFLSFIDFIEDVRIDTAFINLQNKNSSELIIKKEPVYENTTLEIFLNSTSFRETKEIQEERLDQTIDADVDDSHFTLITDAIDLENELLSKCALFFEVFEPDGEDDDADNIDLSNPLLKIYNKYCLLKIFNSKLSTKISLKKSFNSLVFYRICISNLKRDLRIHLTDIITGEIKFMCSARACLDLHFRRVTKINLKIVENLIDYFLEISPDFFLSEIEEEVQILFKEHQIFIPVVLHFQNIDRKYIRLVTKKLKKQFEIHSMDSFFSNSHNGCRPKKIRRVKLRKKKQYNRKKTLFIKKDF